jgi:hypothetical protein
MLAKTLLASALLCLPLHASIILVDFGFSNRLTSTTGWNNIYWQPTEGGSSLVSLTNMVDSTGASTNFGMSITTRGFIEPSGDSNAITGIPSNATSDSFYGTGNASVVTLTNLDPTQTYSFKFYSAVNRPDGVNRTSKFSINGQFVEINAYNNNGIWTDVIPNISPNAGGSIDINMSRGTGNTGSSYLLNIIHIETAPIPEPSAAVLSGMALLPMLRRRRK